MVRRGLRSGDGNKGMHERTTISGDASPSVPREAAVRIVSDWLQRGGFPDRLLEQLAGGGRAAVMEMVYGTVKWRRELEWRIARIARRTPRRYAGAALLTAACELFHMENSPPHAVVNESVALVRRKLSGAEAGFVNAVLRGMLRDRAAADAALSAGPPSLRFSHPEELWRRWARLFGAAGAEQLCAWNNGRAEVVIRPQRAGGLASGLRGRLLEAGVRCAPHPARPEECLVLPRGMRVAALEGYASGAFSVQDPAALTAVDMLNPRPGERILDACAAPGGKTAVLADRMAGCGALVAMEKDSRRARRLIDNLRRLRRSEVTVVRSDLTAPDSDVRACLRDVAPRGFDAILVDAPCSNTGVLRRRPDARWNFTARTLSGLTCLQLALLSAAASLLKPGGRLIYSTCSLEMEENEALVAQWLAEHPRFCLDDEKTLVPPASLTDGAYTARLMYRRHTPPQF